MMLERREHVQHGQYKQDKAECVVGGLQNIEGRFVFADEVGPGEQPPPAYRIILGGRHHPAGQRHGE